jgi:hypothetical protein
MNVRKLQFEIMRAILRSSSLQYEEAFPVVQSVSQQLSRVIFQMEQQKLLEQQKLEKEQKIKR